MAFPTLATRYEHEILGNEYCSGYTDIFNKWNTGFYCPQTGSSLAVYCCGTSVFKYCCTTKPSGTAHGDSSDAHEADIASLYFSETPVIIAVACGIVAVVILIIVSSCFFCSCCFVHKKRSHVPGMYRMEDSSTNSGLIRYNQPQNGCGSQQQINTNSMTTSEGPHGHMNHQYQQQQQQQQSGHGHSHSRPIISIQPQQNQQNSSSMSTSTNIGSAPGSHPSTTTTSMNMNMNNSSSTIRGPLGRSSSVSSCPSPAIEVDLEWSPGPHQATVFHINNTSTSSCNHPTVGAGLSNHISHSILPTPRFSSNQNLSDYSQTKSYYDGSGTPYSMTSGDPFDQQNTNYCTSTLPSCLRRSGNNSAGGYSVQASPQQHQQGQQPLKSILRKPLNNYPLPNNGGGNGVSYRREYDDLEEFDFESLLLPQQGHRVHQQQFFTGGGSGGLRQSSIDLDNHIGRIGYESNPGSYNQYNVYRPFTPDPTTMSSSDVHQHGIRTRRYSNPTTEYQNDLNRFKDLDPESLSRLIELDLDSKL